MLSMLAKVSRQFRAMAKTTTFFLKVFPMLPSRPVDWLTPTPVIEKVCYPTQSGIAEGDLYRPAGGGTCPGILVCLGVVPFAVEHPQVPVLGRALAHAGFAALLYWSPAMRDFRLDPEDVENITLAYQWLIEQPYVDPSRSGFLGTCVGGSFALMAAASPSIQDKVAFIAAYAPFSSIWTFSRDIISRSLEIDNRREAWQVDPLTQKVFIHSITASLAPEEAQRFRSAFTTKDRNLDTSNLSAAGHALYALLTVQDLDAIDQALEQLPTPIKAQLAALSPIDYLKDIHTPLMVILHDQGDQVIPVSESRRLCSALADRSGVHFTEMNFQHLDPVKGKLPLPRLIWEFGKFIRAVYPIFWQAAA